MPNKTTFNDNKDKKLYGFLLIIFVILYSFIWLNKAFPSSEGWAEFYVGLIDSGKTPYKDFYYFLPPLNLFIDYILWKLSFGFIIVYRLWRLLERLLIACIVYKILIKVFNPFISFFITFISIVIGSSCFFDLIGDYNQTTELLELLLGIILVKYTENLDNLKQKKKWLLLAGIIGGFMFLSKQTLVICNFIIFSLFIFLLKILGKEKDLVKMFLYVFLGSSIPISIVIFVMLSNNCFNDFIHQVYIDVSSKGSIYNIIIKRNLDSFKHILKYFLPFLLMFTTLFIPTKHEKYNNKFLYFVKYLLLLGLTIIAIRKYRHFFLIQTSYNQLFLSILILSFILIFFVCKNKNENLIILFTLITISIIERNNINNITNFIFNETQLISMVYLTPTIIHFFLIFWLIYYIFYSILKKKDLKYDLIIYTGMSLSTGWASLMAAGDNLIQTRVVFSSLPTIIIILCSESVINNSQKIKIFFFNLVKYFLITIFTIVIAQKLVSSYYWWGNKESNIWEKTEISELSQLKGFYLSKTEKNKIDKITEVIKLNSTKDSIIWGFPYVKIYNVFLNNYNLLGKTPILFYDVCSDNYVLLELDHIKNKYPDIIVWVNIPHCLSMNETTYRPKNPLKQRKIIEWFEKVKNNDYELIGQASNVLVFKLKNNEIPVVYKFFENKELENNPEKVKIFY